MSAERRKSLEEIFAGAVAKDSPDERAAFLDGACGSDGDLRSRAEALLRAHDEAGAFLEAPLVDLSEAGATTREGPGTRIGPYKLLQLIGEGGFGAVYMAEQEEPVRRRVALKIIKLGMDTKQVIARFEAERQALAMMEHPNISRVLDAGTTDSGRPYFVMELVRGVSLNEYCDTNKLATRDRLQLFLQICRAVQHAHLKGIIHRDLKPSNVLVTLHDGTPVPKVIDFGIARATHRRLTEKTLFTEYGQFIGTPEYMSPEQAEMSGLDIDTRTDVYSLGVILYELLTGTTPLDHQTIREAGWGRIQEVIREHEPEVPSTRVSTVGEEIAKARSAEPASLTRLIKGDLDWIAMKALEKDRTRRYATAQEMAADVTRFLERQPVLAGPPSATYRLRRFVQRHRVGMFAGGLVATAILVGLTLATFGLVQARREAARSREIADFLQDMLASTDPVRISGRNVDVEAVIRTARRVFGDDHATVAATLESRAGQLQNIGNLAAAEPLYRAALRIWRGHFSEDHLNVGITLTRLGMLLATKGDEVGAEKALREALRITEGGTCEARVTRTLPLFQLASILLARRQFEEAEPLYRECLEIVRTTTPDQHLRHAMVLSALANSMVIAGKAREAEPVVRETVTAYERALPAKSLLLAKVRTQVGHYLFDLGAVDDAQKLYVAAVNVYAATPLDPSLDRNDAIAGLGRILKARDDGSVAYADRRREFLALVRRAVPEIDPYRVKALMGQAREMELRGLSTAALALDLEALSVAGKHEMGALIEEARGHVERLGLSIVRIPDGKSEQYEAARRAAEILMTNRRTTPSVVAIQAMADMRLGSADRARDGLEKLKRLVGEDKDEAKRALLVETEKLIEARD
jgi:serine/threonine protein kinase